MSMAKSAISQSVRDVLKVLQTFQGGFRGQTLSLTRSEQLVGALECPRAVIQASTKSPLTFNTMLSMLALLEVACPLAAFGGSVRPWLYRYTSGVGRSGYEAAVWQSPSYVVINATSVSVVDGRKHLPCTTCRSSMWLSSCGDHARHPFFRVVNGIDGGLHKISTPWY